MTLDILGNIERRKSSRTTLICIVSARVWTETSTSTTPLKEAIVLSVFHVFFFFDAIRFSYFSEFSLLSQFFALFLRFSVCIGFSVGDWRAGAKSSVATFCRHTFSLQLAVN